MQINYLPVFGWAINAALAVFAAVPFWFVWTRCEIGMTYFYFLPAVYLAPPFWDCVGLFIILGFIKWMVPSIASVSQSNTGNSPR